MNKHSNDVITSKKGIKDIMKINIKNSKIFKNGILEDLIAFFLLILFISYKIIVWWPWGLLFAVFDLMLLIIPIILQIINVVFIKNNKIISNIVYMFCSIELCFTLVYFIYLKGIEFPLTNWMIRASLQLLLFILGGVMIILVMIKKNKKIYKNKQIDLTKVEEV
jgi:hypothetical protein